MGFLSTGKWLALLAASALLCACSKGIDTVKNSPAPDASYKLGQLLDHKDNCTSVKWSSGRDDKGRSTVDYRCEVKVRVAVLDEAAKKAVVRVSNDIQDRLEHGPRLPVLSTFDDQRQADLRLEALRIPGALANERMREDAAVAAKLDELKKRYDAAVQQLGQADAPCQAQLRQQLADNLARTRKYLEEHSTATEVIRWTLNDGEIVSVASDLTNAEGVSVLQSASANLLYTYMLAPADRVSEERLIVGNVPAPASEETDLNFCGRAQAYQPAIDAVIQVQRDLAAVQKDASPWK